MERVWLGRRDGQGDGEADSDPEGGNLRRPPLSPRHRFDMGTGISSRSRGRHAVDSDLLHAPIHSSSITHPTSVALRLGPPKYLHDGVGNQRVYTEETRRSQCARTVRADDAQVDGRNGSADGNPALALARPTRRWPLLHPRTLHRSYEVLAQGRITRFVSRALRGYLSGYHPQVGRVPTLNLDRKV